MSTTADCLAIPNSIPSFIPAYIDTVPDYLFRYKLDGTDANVVPINTPTSVTGMARPDIKSLLFNGVDEYATAHADSSKVAIGTGAFSIVFWAKIISSASTNAVIGNGSGGAGNGTFRTPIFSNGAVNLRTNCENRQSTNAINDGLWHHVVFASVGTLAALNIYIDGSLDIARIAPDYNFIDTGALTIAVSPSNFMDGSLDDIRFYDRQLSTQEVQSIYSERI